MSIYNLKNNFFIFICYMQYLLSTSHILQNKKLFNVGLSPNFVSNGKRIKVNY